MNNYVGIGIDAKVALEFHTMRDNFPSLFQSQLGNKMWYTGVGTVDLLRRSCSNLHKRLRLECDGAVVELPADAEGLVILNIPCHMGGVFLWEHGHAAPQLTGPAGVAITTERRPALHDGLLEIVAIGGVLHMGRLAVGLSRGQRLCQCSCVSITTLEMLPIQVDGEPWMQPPATLTLGARSKALVLKRLPANSPAARMAGLVREALDAAVYVGTIDDAQRQALTAEIAAKLDHHWL
ncbi:hypothetical protein FOA52_008562 [Chlamydomonas sp. UWO 241]|nr:hypothetical protein FOA52_008562 [Chlamydomonas sp. UWO 241]